MLPWQSPMRLATPLAITLVGLALSACNSKGKSKSSAQGASTGGSSQGGSSAEGGSTAQGGTTPAGGSTATGGSTTGSGGAAGGSGSGTGGAGAGGPIGSDEKLEFAAFGDSGYTALDELGLTSTPLVAEMVNSWDIDFIVHLGDLNYPDGEESTIQANVGQHYARWIKGYQGPHGPGAATNRFFPTPGNHDYRAEGSQPYLDFFPFLEGRRFYDQDLGLLHLISLDSEGPAAKDIDSEQGELVKNIGANSDACWKMVYFHRPLHSSGRYYDKPNEVMRYPYKDLGIDVVMYGHDHIYERIMIDDMLYITAGTGGAGLYNFEEIHPDSQARVRDYGAMRVTVTKTQMKFEFISANTRQVEDTYTLEKSCP